MNKPESEVFQLHPWTEEFECKLGSGGGPWPTRGNSALQTFRWAILRALNRHSVARSFDLGMQQRSACIYVPIEIFGHTDDVNLESILAHFGISKITRADGLRSSGKIRPSFAGYLGVSAQAHIYINQDKLKQPAFDYLGNFAVGIYLFRECGSWRAVLRIRQFHSPANATLAGLS